MMGEGETVAVVTAREESETDKGHGGRLAGSEDWTEASSVHKKKVDGARWVAGDFEK